jgi:hypothetical protein
MFVKSERRAKEVDGGRTGDHVTFVELGLNSFLPPSFSFFSVFPVHLQHVSFKVWIMGFCRRCGEIVSGPKCKCGFTAVGKHFSPARVMDHPRLICCFLGSAPAVKWNEQGSISKATDRWSRTYVSRPQQSGEITRSATSFHHIPSCAHSRSRYE